jgi:CRP/FNR family nitrogen fixation transcriptional regulator
MPAQLLAIDSSRAFSAEPARSDGDGELNLIGVARSLSRDQEIFAEGDSADSVYKVVSGAVRGIRLLADGRRQITDFYLPGDVFGIELGPTHGAAAEALCDAVVISARRSGLTEDKEQPSQLWRQTLRELRRSRDHVLTLGRQSAMERLARFLVDLAARTGARASLTLPMTRQDIADYLGLTIETVSRTLTQMQAKGLVRIEGGRRVRLLRPAALAALCE